MTPLHVDNPDLRPRKLSILGVFLASLACTAACGAGAPTKRAAPLPDARAPWRACSDIEGFVSDDGRFAVTQASCGGSYEAWLTRLPGEGAGSAPPRDLVVLDHLVIGKPKAGERVSSGPYCNVAGKEVRWVAVYDWNRQQTLKGKEGGIHRAWTVNVHEGRFEPAAEGLRQSVVCYASEDE